jgi:hypothetical protein
MGVAEEATRGRLARADSLMGVLPYDLGARTRGAGLFGWERQRPRANEFRLASGESNRSCRLR